MGLSTRSAGLADEAALRAAYDEHGGELYGFALRALGDRGLAEEAVQETFLRAWRAAARFDPATGTLRAWLFAICRNLIVDLARARSVRPAVAAMEAREQADAVDEIERAMVSVQIEQALAQVSDRHRRVLVEVHLRGRPVAEVASELGVPPGTVHSRLYYGLRALAVVLEEGGWRDGR